jgi:CheY-like chemotaxis protein
VLLNLCVNGRDAMPDGGRLVLRLETRRIDGAQDAFQEPIPPGDYRVITVQDTGSGIAPEVLEHIFDPFFTTKEPDRGTGLGLSTTLGIIRGHHGHVAVNTELNLGTRFSVYLPAVAAPAPSPPPTPALAEGAAGRARVPVRKTTLVVDDEVTVRSVVTRSLERLEMPCLEAGDGVQGLRVWEERGSEIGLLIVDLSMPVMDGVTMLKTVRRRAPDLPVIAFSGNITEEHRRELGALAVHKIMAKPFRYDDLVAAVREVLH